MAYAAVITNRNLGGGRWTIKIAETEAQLTSAKAWTLATALVAPDVGDAITFKNFKLIQIECAKTSGAGATILTKLQRLDADGSTYRTMFLAPAAVTEMVYVFNPPLIMHTAGLKHLSQPASGTDNVVWTEYTIEEIT